MTIARLMQMARAGVPAGGGDVWADPDLANASYDSVSFSVSGQATSPFNLFFKPDGTKMYFADDAGDDVNEYDLSTAWDISTASFLQNFSVSAQEAQPVGLFFKPDGTKMYVMGQNGDDVNEYDLSTAWDISTASFLQNFSVSAQNTLPSGLSFKPDGTKMYVMGRGGDEVNEYNLSTAWDISTASFLQVFSVASQESNPFGLFFGPNGNQMFLVGYTGDAVNEYSLSTAWDISTASYVQNFSVASQDATPAGIFFKSDGSKMYIVGSTTDTIYQYSTVDAAAAWTDPDLANASYDSVSFSVATEELSPESLFFKPDGAKMYVLGASGDDVNEYDLSTAWDISTASYLQNFSVASEELGPSGLFLKPDGTKMYVTGFTGDDVNEYDLSSAWDISTASYSQNFSLAAQVATPRGVFFKPDGTKMYISGATNDAIFEYSLSAAWDVSTASYVQSFSVVTQDNAPEDLFFNPDGTKMFVVGDQANRVYEYDLSTAWDISTASYNSVSFGVGTQDTVPNDVFFKSDGSKMYIVGAATDTIYQYSTA